MALVDNHGRIIDYARIAITDKCNLRCEYCMPEEGLNWLKRVDLLSEEEIVMLIQILAELGIKKIRFTGGEPFLRKDFLSILEKTKATEGIESISITTNGTLCENYVQELQSLGIRSVNLSIDSFNPDTFKQITKRDHFPQVMQTFHKLLDSNIQLKINTVVMSEVNTSELEDILSLTRNLPIEIRLIEEMPFNGIGIKKDTWSYRDIMGHLLKLYPEIQPVASERGATSQMFKIPGNVGNIGVIAAYSRTFCGTCNRLRFTPDGILKTCLYDGGRLSVKELLRSANFSKEILKSKIIEAVSSRDIDGFAAEKARVPISESMATIGG